MDFEIKIPAIYGETVPLRAVAEGMARKFATSFGKAPFHKPAYHRRLDDLIRDLLNEAKVGNLAVCSQSGRQGTVEEIVQQGVDAGHSMQVLSYVHKPDWEQLKRDYPNAKKSNLEWDFDSVGVNLGPMTLDIDATTIGYLHVRLHHLNDWGKPLGDCFNISNDGVGWGDERGWIGLTATVEADTAPVHDTATPATVAVGSRGDDAWISKARSRAAEIIKRQREKDLFPSQIDIADEIAREFRTAGVVGAGEKPLSGAYIKRHALNGISSAQVKQLSTQTGLGKWSK